MSDATENDKKNPEKKLTLNGKEFTLKMTYGALREIEDHFQAGAPHLFSPARLGFSVVAVTLWRVMFLHDSKLTIRKVENQLQHHLTHGGKIDILIEFVVNLVQDSGFFNMSEDDEEAEEKEEEEEAKGNG